MPAHAKLVALCCIDPRYRFALEKFIQKKYGVREDEYDLKTDAGGVKEVAAGTPIGEWILKNIDIAVNRHGARRVVACNHVDCAYYGGTDSFGGLRNELERYNQDLRRAAEVIRRRFPGVEIDAYIATREGRHFVFGPVNITAPELVTAGEHSSGVGR